MCLSAVVWLCICVARILSSAVRRYCVLSALPIILRFRCVAVYVFFPSARFTVLCVRIASFVAAVHTDWESHSDGSPWNPGMRCAVLCAKAWDLSHRGSLLLLLLPSSSTSLLLLLLSLTVVLAAVLQPVGKTFVLIRTTIRMAKMHSAWWMNEKQRALTLSLYAYILLLRLLLPLPPLLLLRLLLLFALCAQSVCFVNWNI